MIIKVSFCLLKNCVSVGYDKLLLHERKIRYFEIHIQGVSLIASLNTTAVTAVYRLGSLYLPRICTSFLPCSCNLHYFI